MEKETYEKIIEVLVEKMCVAEWRLKQAEQNIKELKKENERLRKENGDFQNRRSDSGF